MYSKGPITRLELSQRLRQRRKPCRVCAVTTQRQTKTFIILEFSSTSFHREKKYHLITFERKYM